MIIEAEPVNKFDHSIFRNISGFPSLLVIVGSPDLSIPSAFIVYVVDITLISKNYLQETGKKT